MGVILQGILGGFSGKVGPVVGGKWKDIDYMRSYVIPSNPNTVNQQAVRLKFSVLIAMAKSLLPTLIQTYWDPFYSNMSGFNAWVSKNYSTLDGSNDLVVSSLMSKGSLETLHTNTSTYAPVGGSIIITFNSTIQGNGLATDLIGAVVYDKSTNIFYTDFGVKSRSDGARTFNITASLTATNLIVYVFAYRGTGASFVVSDSIGDICSAV